MIRARGQAIVEFLVTAVALVPVLVGIVVVGRLHDVQRAVDQSARYAAFALALGEHDAPALQAEVRARFFGAPDAPVLAADADPRARPRTDANPNWSDYSLDPTPLVPTSDAVTLRVENGPPPGAAARGMTIAASTIERVTAWTAGRFDLETRGYARAAVAVEIAPVRSLGMERRLRLESRALVFGDDWGSDSVEQARERVEALVATAPLRRLRPLFAPFAWALRAIEPAFEDLCLGNVDVELVPQDRLGPRVVGPPNGGEACR